jgi:tellurite resistance protein
MEQQVTPLSAEEIDVFARGLYHLASVDGIDDSETALIAEFLREAGATFAVDDLKDSTFSKYEAVQVLEKTYLRRIFLKTAIALVRRDGHTSFEERRALAELADVFGLSNLEFVELEYEALSVGLS